MNAVRQLLNPPCFAKQSRWPHGPWLHSSWARAALELVAAGVAITGVACETAPAPTAEVKSAPLAAAAPAAATPKDTASPATATATATGAVGHYGAALEGGPSVPLQTLLANPAAYSAQTVTTEGQVQRACSRKGCWMEIGSGDDACRVTFKDYAFFVPTDSAGAFAKIQGRLDTREIEKAAVDHLESEGAHFRNKRPDGSATEVRLIASAVELRR